MADQKLLLNTRTDSHNSKITTIVIPSTQHSCPTAPTRFFRSLNELTLHNNAPNHPPSQIHSPSTTNQPSPTPTNTLDIGTSIFYADSENGSHNLWHLGIPSILQNTDHHPPNFWKTTWCCHSNIETARTFSAYKPTQFKPSPTNMHFPSIPPPSGGYSLTSIPHHHRTIPQIYSNTQRLV